MKYTNKHNLPEEVFNLLSKDRYQGGGKTDYSVTTLKNPPRIVQLQRRHKDEIEVDVIDNLWSMFGSMAHAMLEEQGSDESLSEERLYLEIENRIISGQVDNYKDGIITDYKVTSAWTLVYGSRVKDWEEQLNSYAYLFENEGHKVKELRIIAILRDWSAKQALSSSDYPQQPIQIIPIKLWSKKVREDYLRTKVLKHKECEDLPDSELPFCSSEDVWEQPTKWALMKNNRKTALKLFDNESLAYMYGVENGFVASQYCDGNSFVDWIDGYYLVERKGKRTRCEDYCEVSKWCNQYQKYCQK